LITFTNFIWQISAIVFSPLAKRGPGVSGSQDSWRSPLPASLFRLTFFCSSFFSGLLRFLRSLVFQRNPTFSVNAELLCCSLPRSHTRLEILFLRLLVYVRSLRREVPSFTTCSANPVTTPSFSFPLSASGGSY